MRKSPLTRLTPALLAAASLWAVETKTWQQSDLADFEKGTLRRLSVRSDGRLTLAPQVTELFDSSTAYLWAVAADSKGVIYAGGGMPGATEAKLFAVENGKSRVVATVPGLEIHALAIDAQDRVYAATAPDGKIYRINDGKPEVFYDPKAKYIWALAFDSKGALYVATGDAGEIHRVTPDGKGSVFFRTEETHARSMTVDASGNLIVGTEPGGLILRITPAGVGFVLYQAAKREVTALAVARDGSIYAAAVGAKPAAPAVAPPAPTASPATTQSPAAAGGTIVIAAANPRPTTPPPSLAAATVSGGSDVYRIAPDGYPRRVWSHAQDIVYAIALDAQDRPVLGTGNRGNLYRLDSGSLYTLLVNLAPTQVTAFASRHGALYAVTGNIGKVYQIGPRLESEGSLESDVFDAGAFSYWGRLNYRGSGPGVSIETRTGNLSRPVLAWSPWAAVEGPSGVVKSPPARFFQFKVSLRSESASPEVSQVEVAYLARNVAPVVEQVEIAPPNYKFPAPVPAVTGAPSLSLPAVGQKRTPSSANLEAGSAVTGQYAKGWIGVRWNASDENGDSLIYKVEVRGAGETQWKLLRDKVREKYMSFDSAAFPDGEYVIRVTASDLPSNPPDQSLAASLDSELFVIDNTPPQITGLTASRAGKVELRWTATDSGSIIEKAECSVDGGDWQRVDPASKISDSRTLEYQLTLDLPAGEHTVAVRATDAFDNTGVGKIVVK